VQKSTILANVVMCEEVIASSRTFSVTVQRRVTEQDNCDKMYWQAESVRYCAKKYEEGL